MSSREIIYDLAGGPPEGREVKLWFPGGSSSPVLTGDDLDLTYDFDTMAKAGSMLGSGAIIVVDDSNSVVDVALKIAKFYRTSRAASARRAARARTGRVTMLERIEDGQATPMDLDIMASVQEHIIGNCLCVLGDAMAMPIGSMIAKFRDEFEAHIEAARARNELATTDAAPEEALIQGRSPSAAPRAADDHLHDRRPRGHGAPEHDARRRRQARRRRDPGLLLRAQARRARRRLPHVPRRDRGHPEAADRLLDAGQGRHGRPHEDRPRARRRRRRSSSSCSSTTRSTARSATRAASARCRTSRSAGAAASRASSSPSATSRSRSRSAR